MDINLPFLKQPIGAGDVLKAATSALGVKPCGGCQKRAEVMNRALQLTPRNPWVKPPLVPEGWTRDASYSVDEGKRLERFSHPDGHIMIWLITGEEYKQSHGYCCDGMRDRAMADWERMCLSL